MIVYRVEHKELISERSGTYAGPMGQLTFESQPSEVRDKYYRALNAVARNMNNGLHLTPWADPCLRGISSFEVCGVDSPEAVDWWFGDSLPLLEQAGFVVREYDVPDCKARRGLGGQVVFDYVSANRVEKTGDK